MKDGELEGEEIAEVISRMFGAVVVGRAAEARAAQAVPESERRIDMGEENEYTLLRDSIVKMKERCATDPSRLLSLAITHAETAFLLLCEHNNPTLLQYIEPAKAQP
jgi:hypothetical protein